MLFDTLTNFESIRAALGRCGPWTEPGFLVSFSIGSERPDSLIADLAGALDHLDTANQRT